MQKYLLFLFPILFLSCQKNHPPLWLDFPTTDRIAELAKLPKGIKESSGLVYWQQGLWTLNDGGNGPYLFQVGIHKKEMRHKIKVEGIKNTDWESLAQDSSYFYIGDFGNNAGNRNNLAIHRIKKQDLLFADKKVVLDGSIFFSYQDQKVELLPRSGHNFDCEAMVIGEDSIFLFSKNHGDQRCRIYRLPKMPGKQVAVPIASFDTKGKISGASWVREKGTLALLGYNNSKEGHRPFIWFFSEFSGSDFFSGKAERINLDLPFQTEGICHFQGQQFFLTNEAERGIKGGVYLYDAGEVKDKF